MSIPEVKVDKNLQIELMRQLEALESSTDLEGTAIVTKTGLRIASSSTSEVEADMHSASPSVLISLGEKVSQDLNFGELSEIVVTGEDGYTIMTVGDESSNFMLISHSQKGYKLGYYFHRLRKSYKELKKILSDIEIGQAAY